MLRNVLLKNFPSCIDCHISEADPISPIYEYLKRSKITSINIHVVESVSSKVGKDNECESGHSKNEEMESRYPRNSIKLKNVYYTTK